MEKSKIIENGTTQFQLTLSVSFSCYSAATGWLNYSVSQREKGKRKWVPFTLGYFEEERLKKEDGSKRVEILFERIQGLREAFEELKIELADAVRDTVLNMHIR